MNKEIEKQIRGLRNSILDAEKEMLAIILGNWSPESCRQFAKKIASNFRTLENLLTKQDE